MAVIPLDVLDRLCPECRASPADYYDGHARLVVMVEVENAGTSEASLTPYACSYSYPP
jgi:hypothetical protein